MHVQEREDKQERGLGIAEKQKKAKGKINMLDAVCYCCLILKVKILIPLVNKKRREIFSLQK